MVGFVGGLQRRIGKGEEQPAQENADRALCRKAFGKPAHQRGGQQAKLNKGHAPQRDPQGRNAGIQIEEHPPEIGPQHPRRCGGQGQDQGF